MTFSTPIPEGTPDSGMPYSPVVVSGDFVFICGQVPRDPSAPTYPAVVSDDFGDQTRQVFDNMRRCLAAADCGLEDVVKVNCFIADWDDFAEFNDIYAEYFTPPYPVRTTVQAGLHGFKVEVECTAQRRTG
jgi:2-iminobutanoate/2-iminopropanoate deaminase